MTFQFLMMKSNKSFRKTFSKNPCKTLKILTSICIIWKIFSCHWFIIVYRNRIFNDYFRVCLNYCRAADTPCFTVYQRRSGLLIGTSPRPASSAAEASARESTASSARKTAPAKSRSAGRFRRLWNSQGLGGRIHAVH